MSVAGNVVAARERIAAACARVGRDPAGVQIVAASKMQPAGVIAEAIAAGVDVVGENRVQEAAVKRPLVAAGPPWHLIGPLQRNKAKAALELFDAIETVDRAELADRLELLLTPTGRVVPVYLEVNIGGEAQKNGVMPDAAAALADHLASCCPHLALRGLMTVPPWHPDPERSRPFFAALRELAARVETRAGYAHLQLSMGMSEDFEIAVEEGATAVRLGRVLFGERVTAR
jgi:pyridoxal phosphate enzyme (YggS family)